VVWTRGRVAGVVVLSLVLVGCSTPADDGALDLEDGEPTAAVTETEPAEEVTETPEDDEPLYPPLPPLEPDPDSDVPVEDQEFFLELHARAYEVSQHSYATAVISDELSELFAAEALSEIEHAVRSWRDEGLIQRSPDSEVLWLQVVDGGGGEFLVDQCVLVGPATGLYDAATDEPVDVVGEAQAAVIRTRYGPIDTQGAVRYRAIAVEAGGDEARCPGA
jgi:hypothetical protein